MNWNMGSLELYIGPMFSGKSTMLIRKANIFKSIGKKVFAINHSFDTRYEDKKIITHDKLSIDCIMVSSLDDIMKNEVYRKSFEESDIVCIEELQFFNSMQFIKDAVEKYNKKVIASGLDGDYKRNPFPTILEIIPYCDKVTKLQGFCKMCSDGTLGIFTKRIVDGDSTILVGGEESYICVCRKHFNM